MLGISHRICQVQPEAQLKIQIAEKYHEHTLYNPRRPCFINLSFRTSTCESAISAQATPQLGDLCPFSISPYSSLVHISLQKLL